VNAVHDPAPSPFAEVEPFTGEHEIITPGIAHPSVPLMCSQTQFHIAVAV
jgi:hypothetical protein